MRRATGFPWPIPKHDHRSWAAAAQLIEYSVSTVICPTRMFAIGSFKQRKDFSMSPLRRRYADLEGSFRVVRDSCTRLGNAANSSCGFNGLRVNQMTTSATRGNFAWLTSPVRMMIGGV